MSLSMQKYVAVRLRSAQHGNVGFSLQNANVINYLLEKRDPALRNVTEAMYSLGLEYKVGGCAMFWFHIEDHREPDYYLNLREVEFAFSAEWFDGEKTRIRGLSGFEYIDACEEIAKTLTIKDQARDVNYTLPSVVRAS